MGKLAYFKLMREDFETLNEMYSTAQIGELIVAIMKYLTDGTIVEVDDALKYAFTDFRKKVDRAQKAYDERCETNSKNGSKGGKTKAERARGSKKEKPSSPSTGTDTDRDSDSDGPISDSVVVNVAPYQLSVATKQAIHDIISRIAAASCVDIPSENNVQLFVEHMEKGECKINGEAIRSEKDMEAAVQATMFPTHPLEAKVFEYIFSAYKGLRNQDGEEQALKAARGVCETYELSDSTIKAYADEFVHEHYVF